MLRPMRPLPALAAAFALVFALVFTVAVPAAPAGAQDRDLHWKELAVEAQLDAGGRLHVTERQVMVFTGDWNGGERVFRLESDQELDLESVTRIDAGGEETRLDQGSLAVTNQYDWAGSSTLRWRSRDPSDPPFDHTEITYVLVYTLSNILVPQGGDRYLLAHDFAFTDRAGPIERFTLDLDIHPTWQPESGFAARSGPLPPGTGHIVRIPVRYAGVGQPAGVASGAGRALRFGLAAALLSVVYAFAVRLFRHEATLGRFAPLPPQATIDADWIAEHVLALPPEVVGAAYDDTTGAAEVAAVIARMVAEKKIQSRVRQQKFWIFTSNVLELTLLADRDTLEGYERSLVDALFFSGKTTSTEKIAQHYRKAGFDPASLIREPLARQVRLLRGLGSKHRGPSLKPLLVSALGAIAALVFAGIRRHSELVLIPIGIFGGIAWTLVAAGNAYAWRRDVTMPGWSSLRFLIPLLAGVGVLAAVILERNRLSVPGAVALAFLGVTFIAIVVRAGYSADTAAGIALRKKLAAARRTFARELRREDPQLQDAWFPYLIALGLGKDVDRWFHAFGGERKASTGGVSTGGVSTGGFGGASHGSGRGWTGGGGTFGGGGASGTWAAAAGALASGVSRPSSSSSGGGGGGGGGSSSGGGGGGW